MRNVLSFYYLTNLLNIHFLSFSSPLPFLFFFHIQKHTEVFSFALSVYVCVYAWA